MPNQYENEQKKTIGERIRQVRGKLSQAEFATKLGVSKGAIGSYESEKQKPGMQFLYAVCDNFNIEPRWLLMGEGEMVSDVVVHNRKEHLRNDMKIEEVEYKINQLKHELEQIKEELLILYMERDRLNSEQFKNMRRPLESATFDGEPIKMDQKSN